MIRGPEQGVGVTVKKEEVPLTAVGLVRAVLAVCAPVAPPALVDALAVAAAVLQGGAGPAAGPRRRGPAAPLVGAVGAVGVAVAGPEPRHAGAAVAAEGGGAAGGQGAGRLVAAVVAVGVLVAHEAARHTLAAGAAELAVGAAPHRWGVGDRGAGVQYGLYIVEKGLG